MKLEFRTLRADEIDCRISTVSDKGVSLLFYKDARCDMNILDETVGAMNWQREHKRDNANCVVSIWDDEKEQWISKEDTGTESNTEKEKGLASDSFKRACFNWGIGRELYTAPFVFVSPANCKIEPNKKTGQPTCYDRFALLDISYKDGKIVDCSVWNITQNTLAWSMKKKKDQPKEEPKEPPKEQPEEPPKHETRFHCEKCGKILQVYKGADGKNVSLRAHAEKSTAKFGQVLCLDCINERQNS